jgi:class I fructose-bisphosphate aldolase
MAQSAVKTVPASSNSVKASSEVARILSWYDGESPGVKGALYRIMNHGTLAGTGKMVILPVDQGFEHGPARSFAMNPDAYDPFYHYQMAIDSGCNAYAAPLGSLECCADAFAGQIPMILKMNSSNSLSAEKTNPDQAVTASIDDALRLGCTAIGYTIYPGSGAMFHQFEELRDLSREAKAKGMAVIVWSYARGGNLSKEGELAIDTIAYGAHMACLLGANIVKVKLPSAHLESPEAKAAFEKAQIPIKTQAERVREVVRSCFNGRRIVIFSGGNAKGADDVLQDARDIREGGGQGSIIGRNCFQRPHAEGMKLLGDMMAIFKG